MKVNRNIELINEFLNHKENQRCSLHTIRAYKNDLIQYLNFIIDYRDYLIDAESKHIQYYLNNIGRTQISSKTMSRKLASIKSFYKYLANNKIININIARTIKSPKVSKRLPVFLTIKEIKNLLNYPYGDSIKDIRDKLILELFYSTGIRISELVQIEIKDIDFSSKLIKIKGKGNKERFVIFGDYMNMVLNEYMGKRDMDKKMKKSRFLFPGYLNKVDSDNFISTRTVFSIVKKYINKISDNEKLSPHSMRHSFATHLLEKGANLLSVKELLGHASLSSTQIYTHVKIEKLKSEYKKSHPHGK